LTPAKGGAKRTDGEGGQVWLSKQIEPVRAGRVLPLGVVSTAAGLASMKSC
jgi:hypothetical protein